MAAGRPWRSDVGDVLGQVAAVVEKPFQAFAKAGQAVDHLVVEHLHGQQRE